MDIHDIAVQIQKRFNCKVVPIGHLPKIKVVFTDTVGEHTILEVGINSYNPKRPLELYPSWANTSGMRNSSYTKVTKTFYDRVKACIEANQTRIDNQKQNAIISSNNEAHNKALADLLVPELKERLVYTNLRVAYKAFDVLFPVNLEDQTVSISYAGPKTFNTSLLLFHEFIQQVQMEQLIAGG